jgi:hypothetical protein
LANRFKIPVPPQESLALSLDASDYFTTDGTTWTDRSSNGRNFTLSATGAYVSTGAFPYMNFTANRATIATAVPSATYNTLIVFGTILNSAGNWRSLINNGNIPIIIEAGTNRLGCYFGTFYPCDQNVDVTTLDQVYTRFNMHVWKLSSISPYYQYYFNPNVAPCRPTGVITDSRVSYTSGFTSLGDSSTAGQYWGNIGTVLYYNRGLSDEELVETYQRHMTKYLLPTPFVPMSPVPNGYVFTRSGMYTPGTGVTALKVLVIAGGGGGGGGFEGGGGGAGGILYSGFYYVTAGVPIQVIIGQGGRGARRNSLPENGGNTIFGTLTAIGGGSGASEQNTSSIGPAPTGARSGGSGGGGSWGAPIGNNLYPPGAGTTGQGNSGGAGYGAPYIGGGGGGAATPGFDASYAYAGNGGDGRSWTMMGVTKTYCGGGGGSLRGSGTSSGGLGGGGGGNGAGTGANATYYGSGGGAGGGNGTACMGGDGFQGIVLVEVNVDPYPAPVLQNPGNQNFIAGGQFNINQTVAGIADITWVLTQVYNAPNLSTPANQSFGSTGGTFTVTNNVNQYLTGPLVWSVSPSTGITLQSSTAASATFYVLGSLSAVPTIVTATGAGGASSTSTFTITCTGYPGVSAAYPATNAAQIIAAYPAAPDGLYWINCSGTPTQIYCLMTVDSGGWMLVYETVTPTRSSGAIVYSTNNSTLLAPFSFTRVGYRMNCFGSSAFTSFDSWSSTVANHRIPSCTDGFINNRTVTNLNVVSSNTNVITGTGRAGALEIWPSNYGTGRNTTIGTYGSDGSYDINDNGADASCGYGSFQIHDVTNLRPVICWNDHGSATPCIGFGPNTAGSNPDWTFQNQTPTADFRVGVYIR